jgi:hypothetical protein
MSRWAHLFTDTVTAAPEAGRTVAGDPAYGAQYTLLARVEHGSRLVVGPDGNEVTAEHSFVTDSQVPLSHRVWLPGDDTGSAAASRRIIGVKSAAVPGGAGLFEVFL